MDPVLKNSTICRNRSTVPHEFLGTESRSIRSRSYNNETCSAPPGFQGGHCSRSPRFTTFFSALISSFDSSHLGPWKDTTSFFLRLLLASKISFYEVFFLCLGLSYHHPEFAHHLLVLYLAMAATHLLFFGDQLSDSLPSIQNLFLSSKNSPALRRFLQEATDIIQINTASLKPHERKEDFTFKTLQDVAEAISKQEVPDALFSTVLMCVVRLGELIKSVTPGRIGHL